MQPAFSGTVPEHYARYLVPVLFEPYAAALAHRIAPRPGQRVLELACGTGVLTRALRAALPASATLVATDLSPAMVANARAASGELAVTWQPADAQDLPFGDAAFDAVVCQFGWMFLPDKVRGFAEARRVLAPGGELLVAVWDSLATNPYAAAIAATLAERFPDDPPDLVARVHGYHDRARITADLAAAGWSAPTIEPLALRGHGPSAEALAIGFARGSPLAPLLAARAADPDAFIRALTPRLAAVAGDAPFTPELAALVIHAIAA